MPLRDKNSTHHNEDRTENTCREIHLGIISPRDFGKETGQLFSARPEQRQKNTSLCEYLKNHLTDTANPLQTVTLHYVAGESCGKEVEKAASEEADPERA
ncbi:hypothetical protein Pla52n_48170 [Stieleria varia]|uniref:Uncharacterized protein n=1 Tax=Stieleria varia TaxID=2528005 RepID=A0A5C6AFX1_9BACT|nr:hypothetical protein Pla52n_48170 [Stieleria varia]